VFYEALAKAGLRHIRINDLGLRKGRCPLYVGVVQNWKFFNVSCHIIYLPTDQIYYRLELVVIAFLAFHFSKIIAEYCNPALPFKTIIYCIVTLFL
jgi:hypothetical protein